VAVALARSPMNTAYMGYSLNRFAKGRFILGLGSQVQSQIEDRFSMPWGKPAARMAEYIAALREIWSAWQTGGNLNFTGQFYHHTSMEPLFTPPPSPYGPPKIYLGAVNPAMLRTAAKLADGVILMLTPPRYLHEVILPIIEEGIAATGRTRSDFEICLTSGQFTGVFPVESDAELKAALDRERRLVPYYFSVPNYRAMLEIYGYGDLQPALHEIRYSDLPEGEKWERMTRMIPDELLLAVGTYAPGAQIPGLLKQKFGSAIDRYMMGGGETYGNWGTPEALRASIG
jgi:probable F420-dependent oxidoreductase